MVGRIWTFKDIFPEDDEPNVKRDANGKKIIPPVAYYVFGAATFVTVGMSVMMIPYVREAIKMNKMAMHNFIAHRHSSTRYRSGKVAHLPSLQSEPSTSGIAQSLTMQRLSQQSQNHRLDGGRQGTSSNADTIASDIEPHRSVEGEEAGPSRSRILPEISVPVSPSGSSSGSNMDTIASDIEPHRSLSPGLGSSGSKGKAKSPDDHPEWPEEPLRDPEDPLLVSSRQFNTMEERRLHGASQADGTDEKDKIPPSMYREARFDAFKALGIATAIVATSATAGIWVMSKLLGVSTVEEFAELMRGTMKSVAPNLVKRNDAERVEGSDQNADVLIDELLANVRQAFRERPGQENATLRPEEKTLPS
ncbi:hypothetical protein BD324DRAFT_647687 [Kockovaella imperatae]|uniref:Uncharacterized protein n=1 Tax=Kockovaella imperatae TaxID=4999 RepID=A0A1Y1UT20_9TREE|nr:hypothetical protein BD324DRAFT_647687 [Kockovaella imperatae]ORX40777.1 hypothetical protein BD324DRAFT_647687 [Kockovaella imperatae]